MLGPCPQGFPTQQTHDAAKCQDRGNCTGPGCRVRRAPWVDPILAGLRADQEARAAAED